MDSHPQGEFLLITEQRALDLAEMRALLYAEVTTGRQEIISLPQVFHKMQEILQSNQIAADAILPRQIHESSYAILNRVARCNELLWYETIGAAAPEIRFGCINITSELSRFLNEMHDVTDGLIHIEAADIFSDTYAAVEPRRLHFALLAMFVMLQNGNPARTGFSMHVKLEEDEVRIRMTLRNITPSPENPLPFRNRLHPDATLISEEALLQRFCKTFSARYTELRMPTEFSGVLSLPAADPPKKRNALNTGGVRYSGGRCTAAYVMRSSIISAEYYYDGDI